MLLSLPSMEGSHGAAAGGATHPLASIERMMRRRRLIRQTALLVLLVALASGGTASLALAQQCEAPPTYSRMRQGADDWHARGGGFGYSVPSYMYGGFFLTFGPPVVVAGSWYQRPYPSHFEFARTRWGGAPPEQAYQQELMPRSDCPCANEAAPTPAE